MKNLLTLLILFSASSPVLSIKNYNQGDELYVWAISGLNMRNSANAKADKILNVPYSEKVKVVDTNPFAHSFNYTMVEGEKHDERFQWIVDGYWVEVEYQGQKGYVFDAYLGRYPTITKESSDQPDFNFELIKEYGATHWGGLSEEEKINRLDFESNQRDPDKGHSSSYKLTFMNGSFYEKADQSFSGHTSIFIKDISMEEAYLFFNSLSAYEFKKKEKKNNKDNTNLISVKKDELNFESPGNDIMIKKVKGGVLIESSGGC